MYNIAYFGIAYNSFYFPMYFQSYKSSIEDMEYISELGNGTSGNVVKMRHKSSKKVIAVKVSGVLEGKAIAWQTRGRDEVVLWVGWRLIETEESWWSCGRRM